MDFLNRLDDDDDDEDDEGEEGIADHKIIMMIEG